MKLFRNLVKTLSLQREAPVQISPAGRTWLRGGDDDGIARLVAPYSQCAWVYVAISVLADSLAHVPFRISRGKGKGETLIDSGPLFDLFQNPHPSMSRALFWQTLVSWEALRGEYFILPLDKSGQPIPLGRRYAEKPSQMVPLNPDCFSHILDGNQITGWAYKGAESMSPVPAQVLLPEEVIHWRNFNPYHFWRGISPLSVAMLPATSDYAAAQFMKGLMSNNADAGLIVTTEEMLDENQREQFLAALESRKRRAGTADRPLFLWGKVKVEKPTISSADLQFLENRKLNRQEIGAIFKVPESMMGFAGQKSALSAGSAIEQDRLTFIENTISGLCRRLESVLEPLIKSFDPMLHGWFDLDSLPIMQAARRDRMVTAHQAFSMGVPFNEINQVYDLGFESLPWGDKGYLPASLREVGINSQLGKKTGEPSQNRVACATATPIERLVTLLQNAAEPRQGHEPEASDAMTKQSAKLKVGKLSKFFFEQRGRVLESLDKWRAENGEANKVGSLMLLDISAENDLLLARMRPLLLTDIDERAGLAPGGDVSENSKFLDSCLNDRLESFKAFNQQACQKIRCSIMEGISNAEAFEELIERAKAIYRELGNAIESIALSETTFARQGKIAGRA